MSSAANELAERGQLHGLGINPCGGPTCRRRSSASTTAHPWARGAGVLAARAASKLRPEHFHLSGDWPLREREYQKEDRADDRDQTDQYPPARIARLGDHLYRRDDGED